MTCCSALEVGNVTGMKCRSVDAGKIVPREVEGAVADLGATAISVKRTILSAANSRDGKRQKRRGSTQLFGIYRDPPSALLLPTWVNS